MKSANYIAYWRTQRNLTQDALADLHQHSFRHTAIDLLVNAPNADIRAAQGLAGHATLAMTMKYVHSQPRGAARFEKNYNLPSLSPESENEKYDTKK